ncbi:MAG: hypothetical protein H6833_05555 [Planctomycetes bacterium]|nr:hypothetical protein [Planctomycetota bacterium]
MPLAYDKDLQEDKEALFEGLATWEACLEVTRLAVASARFDEDACREACGRGYLDATELADALVRRGVPFRDAHEQVGRLVRAAIELDVELSALDIDTLRRIAPAADEMIRQDLTIARILKRRTALGAANPRLVQRQAQQWLRALSNKRA